MNQDDLAEWTPFSLRWERSGPVLDWHRLGGRRFMEPFFDQTIHLHQQEVRNANRTTLAEAWLDRMEAPQKALDLKAKLDAEVAAKDEKSRLVNKPGFRP